MSAVGRASPALSIVVGGYEMARELPRTLRSLATPYQRGIARAAYEVILVDNGSAVPPVAEDFADLDLDLTILHLPDGGPSPAAALNRGLAACRGALIGVLIDGARMASPGLLAAVTAAARLHDRAILFTHSGMLGTTPQWQARTYGYDQAVEDALLASIGWPEDGDRLFEIASWPSVKPGQDPWRTAGHESNALFMPRTLWDELGGYETAFRSPGGGAVSADLYIRACALPATQLVVIGGEATFHQYHSDSASTANPDLRNRLKMFSREYHALRKRLLRVPDKTAWYFDRKPGPPPAIPRPPHPLAGRYVDLLKRVVLNETDIATEARLFALETGRDRTMSPKRQLDQFVRARDIGLMPASDRLPASLTMIGRRRLDNLAASINAVLDEGIAGDLMECGVWRGGAALVMAGIVAARGADRVTWLADSFAGLPPGDPGRGDPAEAETLNRNGLAVTLDEVRATFARFGLLDERVRFLPGWFADTLPTAPVERLAVLRLDGDFYESTMTALRHLYDRLAPGGFLIIDDYGSVPSCAQAVTDFRAERGIETPITKIDWTGVQWRKEGSR